MANFEPSIAEIHLYCDDDFISEEIRKKNFANLKLHGINEIKVKNTSKELDFSITSEYFDEEKVKSIIGDKHKDITKESYEICFVSSKEEFVKLENFKGVVICLESSYVDAIRKDNIVVKEKEQVLSVIYSIYYCSNSYHIFPYSLYIDLGQDFNINIYNIDIREINQYNIIVWNYREFNSDKNLKVVFINTKDYSIRQLKGVELDNKITEKINGIYFADLNDDSILAMNYTIEL